MLLLVPLLMSAVAAAPGDWGVQPQPNQAWAEPTNVQYGPWVEAER